MADRKITLKRNNAGTTEVLYPTTTVDQLFTSDGATAVFSGNKIKVEYLPDAVFDNLKFYGTFDATGTSGAFSTILEGMFQDANSANRNTKGYYLVANVAGELDEETATAIESQGGEFFKWSFSNDDAGSTAANSTGIIEVGDWIVVTDVSGIGTSGNPYVLIFGVVNNTYEKATTAVAGIVELATNTETSTGTDTERAVTPAGLASVLTSYVTTDNDTTYTVGLSGADDNVSLDLNAGGSGSGTDSITFTAGTAITLNLTGDNMEIGFNGTIPTITLNNTGTTTPSFYAPTASGTAGSGTVSRQGLFSAGAGAAPTWVDAPKVFYDDITGWLHGDIVIDLDA
jgi:hypothetical protein